MSATTLRRLDHSNTHAITLRTQKLTPVIGAEVAGVDLSNGAVSPALSDALHAALMEHKVLFLRSQPGLTPAAQLELARSFGEPEGPHPVYPHCKQCPQVTVLEHGGDRKPPDANEWHTDCTFRADPPFTTLLYSRVIPPVGGDTLWVSMTAAYEALSDGVKAHISTLSAVHDMGDFRNSFATPDVDDVAAGRAVTEGHRRFGSAVHPVVQTHPITGKKYLFVNPSFTCHVLGMGASASRALLDFLFAHATQPQFTVRFKWTPDTLVFWDNRCTMHLALADYLPAARRMHRVTVLRDKRVKHGQPRRHTSKL